MPTISDALAIALQHHQAGRLQVAEQIYRQVLAVDPNDVDAWHFLGVIAYQIGNSAAAVECIRRALQRKPDFAEAHYNLGNAFLKQARLDDAIASYRRAMELGLNTAIAHYHLGIAFQRKGMPGEAAAACRQAIALNPEYAEAHTELGTSLKAQGNYDEAIACYRRAVELKPDYAEAHSNLGVAFQKQGKLDDAVACYRQAAELKPALSEAHCNLGLALQEQGNLDDAEVAYRRALKLQPDLAEARFCQSTLLLLRGDFESGLPGFEWRWKTGRLPVRNFGQPAWAGQPLSGRRILLQAEQGLGDTLQFIRYAPLIKSLGATVLLECHRPLTKLLQGLPGLERLIAQGEELPAFDFHLPLLSLPLVFKTTLKTIPANVPYLPAGGKLVALWRQTLEPIRGLRIGINWHGREGALESRRRDLPLDCFGALAQIPGVRLISLQKGAGRTELCSSSIPIVDPGDDVDTSHGAFVDTAAIMANLDLVITSDTALPHLAGGLGIPVWLALPFVPEWRWLLDRSDSPWYPTMRLFRQKQAGDWSVVFEEIHKALHEMMLPQ